MLLKILKEFIPPIFSRLYLNFFSIINNSLFDGNDLLFKKLIKDVEIYGEYGCGESTKWILKYSSSRIISIDTSKDWVKKVKKWSYKYKTRLTINHADLGEVGKWGRPIGYSKSSNFKIYTDYIWMQPEKPNIVLIDGRFRVCCFLTSLKFAQAGTKIIFDDYVNRNHYHFIEKYVSRIKECGRQCLFIVPNKEAIDMDSLNIDIESFRFVMD